MRFYKIVKYNKSNDHLTESEIYKETVIDQQLKLQDNKKYIIEKQIIDNPNPSILKKIIISNKNEINHILNMIEEILIKIEITNDRNIFELLNIQINYAKKEIRTLKSENKQMNYLIKNYNPNIKEIKEENIIYLYKNYDEEIIREIKQMVENNKSSGNINIDINKLKTNIILKNKI